jgi:hypothetical protein
MLERGRIQPHGTLKRRFADFTLLTALSSLRRALADSHTNGASFQRLLNPLALLMCLRRPFSPHLMLHNTPKLLSKFFERRSRTADLDLTSHTQGTPYQPRTTGSYRLASPFPLSSSTSSTSPQSLVPGNLDGAAGCLRICARFTPLYSLSTDTSGRHSHGLEHFVL